MYPRNIFFACIILICCNRTIAQDPHFSQFYANRVYLNPAYAGFDAGTTVTLNYRDQWFGLPDGDAAAYPTSFRTMSTSADFQLPCLFELDQLNVGLAFSGFMDDAGTAPLRTTGFGVAMSYELHTEGYKSKLRRLDFRIGWQLSMMQKSLSGDYFIYSKQLDPVAGLVTTPNTLNLSSGLFINGNVGVMVRGSFNRSKFKNTLFTIGANFANINQPDQALRDSPDPALLPIRTTIHMGSTHLVQSFRGVRAPLYIAPQFRWDIQSASKLNLQTIGAYLLSKGFYTGLFYQYNFRNATSGSVPPGEAWLSKGTKTLILNAGIDVRSALDNGVPWRKRRSGIVLGLTYDLNLTGLTSDGTLGALELSLRMHFAKDRKRGCGEIGKFELYDGKCPVRF